MILPIIGFSSSPLLSQTSIQNFMNGASNKVRIRVRIVKSRKLWYNCDHRKMLTMVDDGGLACRSVAYNQWHVQIAMIDVLSKTFTAPLANPYYSRSVSYNQWPVQIAMIDVFSKTFTAPLAHPYYSSACELHLLDHQVIFIICQIH